MKQYLEDLKPEEVIARLKQGEILKSENGTTTYEYIEGFIVGNDKDNFCINPCIASFSCIDRLYFDMPEPEMVIEVGKFYQTRNGLKAYAYTSAAENRIAVVVEKEIPYTVSINGYVSDESENDLDLIKPYSKSEQIIQLCKEGKTHKEISKELGIPVSTVSRTKTKFGISEKHTKDKQYKQIKNLLERGLTYDEMAKNLNKNYSTVARYVSSHKELYELYKNKRERK